MGKLIKCKECGKIFERKSRQVYCGTECLKLASSKKRHDKYVEETKHIRNNKKVCVNCGKEFYGGRSIKYCSKACRVSYQIKKEKEKQQAKEKDRYKKSNKNEQLCCSCKNFCFGCSWSEEFKPVEGWKAIPTKIRHSSRKKLKDGTEEVIVTYDRSYRILSCPKYEKG